MPDGKCFKPGAASPHRLRKNSMSTARVMRQSVRRRHAASAGNVAIVYRPRPIAAVLRVWRGAVLVGSHACGMDAGIIAAYADPAFQAEVAQAAGVTLAYTTAPSSFHGIAGRWGGLLINSAATPEDRASAFVHGIIGCLLAERMLPTRHDYWKSRLAADVLDRLTPERRSNARYCLRCVARPPEVTASPDIV